ncbi:MAG: SRPBCC domain-containing protein [Candidatus Dormibacteraeota bacterium]|nr:SRPBCC domain-containing protein [Candidatus Dormibacteraeota bacterium]
MIEPLHLSFTVACPAEHAFTTWTAKASAWWPPEHTGSGLPGSQIVFEPRVGGRVFERTVEGSELEWGEVTAWEPPRRLAYRWHIRADRSDATDVEILFHKLPDASTRVEIEHRGWERLGQKGAPWREANQNGWNGVLPAYRAALAKT